MLVTSIFSFSHNVFYPPINSFRFFTYIYFIVCKCFEFGRVQNFVVWYRVKRLISFSCIISECTCVEGICKDGPLGDGTCRSCFNVGFSRRVTGENCDKLFFPCGQRAQNDIHCHVDAMCVVMSPSYMK